MKYWLPFPKVFLVLLIPISGFGALPDTWNIRTAPSSNHLQGVAYGHGLFVAVGDQNTILTSPTGTDWMQRTSGVSVLHSATTGNGWFVAGGQEAALIRSSRDGINWTNGIGTTGLQRVFGFTHANNLFVGVGRGTRSDNSFSSYVVTSRNAIDWDYPFLPTTNTLLTNTLLAVTHGTNLFVAVGETGTIITSTDGTTWTVRNSGTLASLRAIAFHQSRFIAAGDGGIVLASPDGISWSAAPPASFDIRALASGPGALVAVGSFGSSGRLQASPDGLSWPGTSRAFGQPLNAIVYGPGSFVASGDGGLILQSEDSANYWTKPSSGYWEEPYWSLGQLPSSNQAAIVLINPGWKALAFGSSSTANYPDSLPTQRLIVGAPAASFNQLLLNYAGL